MDIKDLERIDTQKMHKVYDDWPNISKNSLESDQEKLDIKGINHVVFSGMGGSGSIGDVISSILSKENIHVTTVKGYHIPNNLDKNSLVVTTSISGNTRETLAILENAKKTDAHIAAFSSGGDIENFCSKNDIFYQKIPMIHSPRASFTKFLFTMLKSLEQSIPIKSINLLEAVNELEKTKKTIFSGNLKEDNTSLELAKWINDIPLIYYPWGLQSAAIRFKNSLQENSKMHVITEDVIEACHNGIVAWEKKSKIKPILIRGKDDFIKTKERWQVLIEFFDKENIEFFEINSISGNILSKIVNLIFLFDYCSIYHGVLNNIDPSPVRSIDYIKNKL
ncbi:glucose-6-phosphate isomerase [Candidatus Nitrosopelagicus brevis]|uniref:Glucose-6-phosphate isomerase n=1 Tax=Candidatus Nitrosopelagicus brevis TaxID=1410606 RepID=A0A0A7V9B2_9ARCH|nr:SIS domain-containing protein [Candidatus Nitrosopelagicus brevis]AJA93245.1 putative bifunctional phosphoglucose/phosphomannose isomerase [Candidatus Nitrosopelagicus brevis]PTL87454.1 glucose-6-phosphate isomerase [Candidatus Nitrosopelagicus brevis]|tara:strand:- start:357 stop:1364 length:1008 start_codon:yes stop_codon:yes gene_type:complete